MKTFFLQVKKIIKETADAVTIEFWHPINEQIKYKAGQFITIAIPVGDKKIKRSYSMSSSPETDTAVAVTVKRVHEGLVSNYLNDQVKEGDFLEVLEPMGSFCFEPVENASRNIVLIGAGSGITPLISIAKSALMLEKNTKVFLLYGNRTEESIIFKEQISKIEVDFADRFSVQHILSSPSQNWAGAKGRIEGQNINVLLNNWPLNVSIDNFYLCGPVKMMHDIKEALPNTPEKNIHAEKFNAIPSEEVSAENDTLIKRQIIIKYEGTDYNLEVAPHQTILEAALEKDIDLPYSCQAGMCTACMGKCISGQVKMDEEEGLTEAEIKQGYVLTCVSHPVSDGVVIEID